METSLVGMHWSLDDPCAPQMRVAGPLDARLHRSHHHHHNPPPPPPPPPNPEPITSLHYAPNGNFASGDYNAPGDPGSVGFNLADVGSAAAADALPAGVRGLIYTGLGFDAAFQATVLAAANDPKVYGFYVADDATGSQAATIKAEDDFIHANAPGKVAFVDVQNDGSSPQSPVYSITPQNTDADLVGFNAYPIRPQFPGGEDLNVIDAAFQEAQIVGWDASQIVPVYQAFGGGDYASWTLPTADQERQILAEWGKLTPNPAFDYAYSWGQQSGDSALANSPDLQAVFAQHNALV